MAICNKDCLNCIFPDCIRDGVKSNLSSNYYARNKEKCKERARKWQKEHPEKVKEYNKKAYKKYAEKHKEEIAEWHKQYYLEHKEEYKERRRKQLAKAKKQND